MDKNEYILTIAGLDPSSGAGITSDIKTFEAHNVYGLSVCSAITVQNDISFNDCQWVAFEIIIAQIDILFKRFKISVVKIGIIESWQILSKVIDKLKSLNPEIKIILDPIIKASAGFNFHLTENQNILDNILKKCYVITPNYDEVKQLYPHLSIQDTIKHISKLTNIYLKGGHRTDKKGWDELYYNEGTIASFPPIANNVFEKHGSGCVLSSSLASNILLNNSLENASKNAKRYTEAFLNSNKSLLGEHIYAIK